MTKVEEQAQKAREAKQAAMKTEGGEEIKQEEKE